MKKETAETAALLLQTIKHFEGHLSFLDKLLKERELNITLATGSYGSSMTLNGGVHDPRTFAESYRVQLVDFIGQKNMELAQLTD